MQAHLGAEQPLGDLFHALVVILAWEQVTITIHRDLKRCVPSECLHRLRGKHRFDPRRHRKMA